MVKCPNCGYQLENKAMQCPECGSFYSKIAELIAAEEADEELHSFKGQCKRIMAAENVKQALLDEVKQFKAGLSLKAKFTMYLIIAFVVAMTLAVL